MRGGSDVDPVLSMSLFKSPDCAEQVWQWLDKHGDMPIQRERFKHLVGICTVKPVKLPSSQPVQRTSGTQNSTSIAANVTARQQGLMTQGSKRFVPEASLSHKPAALARPASAAAATARRRQEFGQRPATAAGISKPHSTASGIRRSLLDKMQPQALPKALSKQLNKQTETVGTATSPQLNVQALTALQPHQATDVSSSSTVMSSNESAGIAPSKPAIVKTTAAAPCRSAAPVQTAAYQAETSSASASKAAADTPRASLTVAHSTTESNTALQQQAQPMGPSSRPSTSCSSRSSRSSSGKRTKAGCSSFDTRLALLHKGLPTSFTPTMTSRPVSRSSRPSAATQHVNAASADSQALSGTNNEAVAVLTAADSSNKVSIQASDRQELEKATDAAAKTAGTEGEALSPAQMAAQLQSELNAAKPQSPTSVLPTADLLNTTYHNFYGLAEAYPELYQQAAAAGRAHKANARALVSVLADTLKGDSSLWKKQLCSTMSACNNKLAHDMGWDTLEGLGDQAFLKWAACSQLYSTDLLEPDALKGLTLWMESAPAAEKRDMMALLRDLHASVNPTGPHLKSVSHSVHTKQVPFINAPQQLETAEATALTPGPAPATGPAAVNAPALVSRPALAKCPTGNDPALDTSLLSGHSPALHQGSTSGHASACTPAQASVSGCTAAALPAQTQPQGKKARGINVNAVPCPDTFRSSINLSEGAPTAFRSTYTELHASSMPQLMQAVQTVAQQRAQAQKPVLVTAPFGKLDPLMDHAHLSVFPVPSGLLQTATEPHTDPDRTGLDSTQYGQSFCSNLYKQDAAARMAANQRDVAASKAAGTRVTIPLGKKAVNCVPVYDTTYHDEYQPRPFDVARQHASAEHVRSMFHAPTATVGCMTG